MKVKWYTQSGNVRGYYTCDCCGNDDFNMWWLFGVGRVYCSNWFCRKQLKYASKRDEYAWLHKGKYKDDIEEGKA